MPKFSMKKELRGSLISTLRLHEVQLDTNKAHPELKKIYEIAISENFNEMFRRNKSASQ